MQHISNYLAKYRDLRALKPEEGGRVGGESKNAPDAQN